MEEILASIRKIISEDAPEADSESGEGRPAAEASTVQPTIQSTTQTFDDVLELTEEAQAPALEATAPQPAQEPVSRPVPDPAPEPQHDVVFAPAEPEPQVSFGAPSGNDIFSDTTRKAMDDVFAAIPDEPATVSPPQPAPTQTLAAVDAATVEGVFERAVRESFEPVLRAYLADNSSAIVESMKPAIREWMDEHFPALLEGAVRAEVERVVKARGSRR
jgi:cell pole-organizing protein PopZ